MLVDSADRLRDSARISALTDAGYAGPFSFEPFAPEVHALPDPEAALGASIAYVSAAVAALKAA